MTQSDAKLQNRWEKILKARGLGISQPMTDNSEGNMAQPEPSKRSFHGNGKDMRKWDTLRNKLDGSDGFMEGHQIMKVATKEREVPEWALSNKEVQRVLNCAFPKLKTRAAQKRKAAIWARIIYLYYRMEQPRQVVAREMDLTKEELNHYIQYITFAERGLNLRGRPRKRSS